MYTSNAKIQYDFNTDILKANLLPDDELLKYYKFLYYKNSFNVNQMWTPRYDGHITIYRPTTHGFVANNPARYHEDLITFKYNPEEIYDGGHYKNFLGFYMPVYSKDIDKIKKYLGIPETCDDSLHISLFSNKKNLANKNYATN